ncbi:biotin--[acetyl-CoA-carboxylase] ligase [Amorphus sp. 3PC139-8]|uniref:biotin--[acetyl-CoA-carboxylase] ligase n=1 Tax=Amorphus sp. 3PC139-8 TaxID=2735676 RepID=UPI00345C88BB
MDFQLASDAVSVGYRLESFAEIGSTNAEALARAEAGDKGPLWLVTRNQTAGRGRRGRSWASTDGNLAATLLLSVPVRADVAATLGFAAGLAALDALEASVGVREGGPGSERTSFALKWPNDVLWSGAKIAGILLEARPGMDATVVAIGIGINVTAAPAGTAYQVASLAEIRPAAKAADLFKALSRAWVARFSAWQAGGPGFVGLRSAWMARAAGLGGSIAVDRGDGTLVRGIYETVDPSGHLVVRSDDGSMETIAAGDVHFGAAATVRS